MTYQATGLYRVQYDYATRHWCVMREIDKYGGSWERVEWCAPMRTAKEALQLARMSVNRLGPWKLSRGRGRSYWTAAQAD